MKNRIRKPVVAGTFYPDDPEILSKELADRIVIKEKKKSAIALISPHAGYFYSGNCAGKGFGAVQIPERVIILGLDHRGTGYPYALDGHDYWRTPLGQVDVDTELRHKIASNSNIFKIDDLSGLNEHSIEVQVPFLQYLNPDLKILPILIAGGTFSELELGGIEIADTIKEMDDDVLIIASTDMSHYVSSAHAYEKDHLVIEKIKSLDPEGLLRLVHRERISMCGVSPVVMTLVAAKELGAGKTDLIEYTNSGEMSGDFDQVVGYLSMIIE